jgi:hypothetical protein
MFRSFFTTIFRGSSAVLCAVTLLPADLRSLNLYYYAVCGRMYMSSVRVWCSCQLVICISPTENNTKHAQMTYTYLPTDLPTYLYTDNYTMKYCQKPINVFCTKNFLLNSRHTFHVLGTVHRDIQVFLYS